MYTRLAGLGKRRPIKPPIPGRVRDREHLGNFANPEMLRRRSTLVLRSWHPAALPPQKYWGKGGQPPFLVKTVTPTCAILHSNPDMGYMFSV